MLFIPGSPHARLLQSVQVLDSTRMNPESTQADDAFLEFLRLSRQTALIESTLLPLAAAIAVTMTSKVTQPLSGRELAIVIVGFSGWLVARSGFDPMQALGIGVFSAPLLLGQKLIASSKRQ
jgi:hypothetical protein